MASRLLSIFSKANGTDSAPSHFGDETLASKKNVKTGILADLQGLIGNHSNDAATILEMIEHGISGAPIDDKSLLVS
jgi:hypothetical protein